mgnify:CR=1 FL=1
MDILNNLFSNINAFFTPERIADLWRVGILIIVGLPIIFLIKRWVSNYISKNYAPHYGMLSGKIVLYTGLMLIGFTTLHQLGFSLAPLLGAAGILGVAIGFASQTSVSNIISGLFLIAEQPFKVDDIITIEATTGVVISIDVLSVKLRTFDNKFVRIPNESIIKQQVTNLTRFPIRRFNANISVAYKENLSKVREILMDVAEKNEYCLSEPEPLIILDKYGTSSIDLLFLVWAETENYIYLKTTIYEEVKARFDAEGIEIPFPHLSLYAGEASKPLKFESVSKEQAATDSDERDKST